MKAPFPWFGGKSSIAAEVWARLAPDVSAYVEPFAGSAAMLLARPDWTPDVTWIETINDFDGFVSNFWRSVQSDPDAVAHHADWPVNENDLHARHHWLITAGQASMRPLLEGDPDWYDPQIAGWWVWGASCWIGSGWCSGRGPWTVIDGQLVHLGDAGQGVNRQRVHLGDAGQGDAGDGTQGLYAWIRALSDRLARVRVISGDWQRAVTPAARGDRLGPDTAIFLDPPYSLEEQRDMDLYAVDSGTVAHDVREWAIAETAAHPRLRVAICGYTGSPHDTLHTDHGWTPIKWTTAGGMGNTSNNGRGLENRHRECIWFSPGCITPAPAAQSTLFDETETP